MKRPVVVAAVLLVMVVAGEAFACGDKFLVVGRGARFQRGYVAVYPGSILVVDSDKGGKKNLLLPLRRAGHRADVVSGAEEIRRAVATNDYDVVLAEWSRASEVASVVSSAAPSLPFVPILDGASKRELEDAVRQYGCPLESKNSKVAGNFLARLDEVIEAKRKSRPPTCGAN
ncbi:MAG TPA: hypothetical protein VM779_09405 [Thermoanaerobaculia bacterium]|nr:hypothetical protein [Thermoanaerobaculia bacterium]